MADLIPAARESAIIWQAGDDTPTVVPVRDRTGALVDVSGWTAVAAVTANGSEVHRWSTFDGTAETGPDGVRLIPAASEDWVWHRGRYDVRVWAPNGSRSVVQVGDMLVRPVRSHDNPPAQTATVSVPEPGQPLPPRGPRRGG